jgi:hypothetical protein
MAISNGFDEALVIPALTKRKGWKQPTIASFTRVLAGDVITNLSGLPYNRDHAACSPVLLWKAQEDPAITSANFNAYLLDLQASVIMDSLNGIFMLPQIIESPTPIFSKNFRTAYKPIPNTHKFCGWQIDVAEGDYAVKIDSVGLLMSGPCTVTLYLYNDLLKDHIWTKDIIVTAGQNQQITDIDDLILHYSDDTHKTGTFFLGYYQDQLDAQDVTSFDVYLDSFSGYNMLGYQCFEADSNYDAKTFVRSQYQSNYRTFGLNLEISTYNDFTNTIVRNASQFDRLLGMTMSGKCIGEVMNSSRINKDSVLSQEQLQVLYRQLEGSVQNPNTRSEFAVNIPYRTGLKNAIERERWRMTQTFLPDAKIFVGIPPVNNDDDRKGMRRHGSDMANNWGYQL